MGGLGERVNKWIKKRVDNADAMQAKRYKNPGEKEIEGMKTVRGQEKGRGMEQIVARRKYCGIMRFFPFVIEFWVVRKTNMKENLW